MSEAAKKEKAKAILDTAEKMFLTTEYEKLKMEDIAKEMGISKGLLFVYFKTKEMLFLELLIREYLKRLDRFENLIKDNEFKNYDEFKKLVLEEMKDVIENSDIYVRLCSIRAVILEKNVDLEKVIEIKKFLYERMKSVSTLFCNKFDAFSQEEVMEIFHSQEAIIVGCKLISTLPKEIEK